MSATIDIKCPSCKSTLELEGVYEDWAGQTIECPQCNTSICIAESPPAPSARLRVKSADNQTCSNCGAVMEADSVFCVECGTNQKTGLRLRTDTVTPRPPATVGAWPHPNRNRQSLSYDDVPWYRKNGFAILLAFIPIASLALPVLLFTGDIYYQKGGQVRRYSLAAKIFIMLFMFSPLALMLGRSGSRAFQEDVRQLTGAAQQKPSAAASEDASAYEQFSAFFAAEEAKAVEAARRYETQATEGTLDDSAFADKIETECLKRWENVTARGRATNIPQTSRYRKGYDFIMQLASLRSQALRQIVNGLRQSDEDMVKEGVRQQQQADQLIQDMKKELER